jgi:hypothetical protein
MEMMPGKIHSSTSEAKKCYKQAAPGNVPALGRSIGSSRLPNPWAGPSNRNITLGNYREPPAFYGFQSRHIADLIR